MTKNILLAATAAGALAFGGAASAHEISFRAGPVANAIDATEVNAVADADGTTTDVAKYGRSLLGLYLIAEESLGTSLGSGVLALQDPLTPGAQLPSGNNLYTITLTNATFGTAVTNASISGPGCTAVISSGGGANDSQVTFLVSTSGASCNGFTTVDLPVLPTAAGTVSVSTLYQTEQNNTIDGGLDTFDAIYAIDAFQPAFNRTFSATANSGPGAGVDTFAQIAPATVGGMPYTVLGGDGTLGRLAIYVDARAERTLDPAGPNAAVADVTAATVTATGDFTAFDGAAGAAGNPTLEGNAATTVTATTATFTAAQAYIVEALGSKPNGSPLFVTADGAMIPSSTYGAQIAYSLATGYTAQPVAGTTTNFETIEREGTNFIAPWTGGSQAQSQSVIRMSSTGVASGAVTLVLTNAVGAGNVTVPDISCNAGVVPAAGDLVIGAAQLSACFGAFLRGDVLITVEAAPAALTAKMRNTNATGTFETTLGRYSGSTIAGAAQ